MSSTRTATPGGRLRQERFCSSFERGLMGNLVAKRVAVLDDGIERGLIWFLQWLSWQRGGLSVAPIPGLEQWCLDPNCELSAAGLDTLVAFRADWVKSRAADYVETSVGRCIADALDYTRSARTTSIIDGASRIGKTFAVRRWCEQSAGTARYVQVPSATDLASFLRAVGEGLGLATNLNLKAQVIHDRIRDTIAQGDLTICFDEAHYLWPQGRLRCAVPARVNWIMTELCNIGVPVAIITTPQFYTVQAQLERQTAWSSEQWVGRIGHVERLSERLSPSDLMAVARAIFPAGDPRAHATLASYAAVSKKHLASIEAIVKRARWLAARRGLAEATGADVETALKECVIPGDAALAVSLRQNRREACAATPPTSREMSQAGFTRASMRTPGLVVKL